MRITIFVILEIYLFRFVKITLMKKNFLVVLFYLPLGVYFFNFSFWSLKLENSFYFLFSSLKMLLYYFFAIYFSMFFFKISIGFNFVLVDFSLFQNHFKRLSHGSLPYRKINFFSHKIKFLMLSKIPYK